MFTIIIGLTDIINLGVGITLAMDGIDHGDGITDGIMDGPTHGVGAMDIIIGAGMLVLVGVHRIMAMVDIMVITIIT
jgi:hypothetical protein